LIIFNFTSNEKIIPKQLRQENTDYYLHDALGTEGKCLIFQNNRILWNCNDSLL